MNDAIQQLLSHSRPTMSTKEERSWFEKLREKRKIVDDINKITRKKTHVEHCRRWRAQQVVQECRTRIVEANLPLVVTIAKKAKYKNLAFADLVSEGNLTLLKCVDKFDPGRGYKFSTYCARSLFRCFSTLGWKEGKHHINREEDYGAPGTTEEPSSLAEDIREVIDLELNDDEAAAVRHRNGIGHTKPKSISDTAAAMKISKKKVVALYESGMDLLRTSLTERGFGC